MVDYEVYLQTADFLPRDMQRLYILEDKTNQAAVCCGRDPDELLTNYIDRCIQLKGQIIRLDDTIAAFPYEVIPTKMGARIHKRETLTPEGVIYNLPVRDPVIIERLADLVLMLQQYDLSDIESVESLTNSTM
ncbi:hypothetical protein J4460_07305 [Candidatus Woesearchaeota archaeon]|nr:hypothetical protein [Candidatus Woesearchaeota archaeon]HIH37971.1 hypothetical protein [Candidatus Woesearchaeota archaeon]HIH48577.1 hypothetical protein [Candidatus Woesearchaeota archaeon]HIJ03568.1 hypothetical protein [Candidatus Woesearchaeota archaeon]